MYEFISFGKMRGGDFFEQRNQDIHAVIKSAGKEYILGIDETEYQSYLIEKYKLELLIVDTSKEVIEEPKRVKVPLIDQFRGQKFEEEGFSFRINYPFTGSSILFELRPSTWTTTSESIEVSESSGMVSFNLITHRKDANEFQIQKERMKHAAFANLQNVNKDAEKWNMELPLYISRSFKNIKSKYLEENEFFQAINLKVNTNKSNVFSAPTIHKKTIIQPVVAKTVEYSSEPTLSKENYKDIINIINIAGKTMEKKPSLYRGKDEESLRDQFLLVLESRYDGTSSIGEAFNKDGKTDVMLKYKDGTNLFIAECKFWKGASEFHKAISQLFDKYLTWRDSKVAVIMFVKNNDFTAVLKTVKEEAPKHKNFVKENGSHGESSFSYIFNLPQDKDKEVYLEVMAFHYFQ